MSLAELKHLHDKEPDQFCTLLRSMARFQRDSMEIEGLHVTEDAMFEAMERAYRERVNREPALLAA